RIQSLQRAEATNSVIKRQLNYQNISIYDIFMELEERLATEVINNSISNNTIEQSAVISISQFNISIYEVDIQLNYDTQTNMISLLCMGIKDLNQDSISCQNIQKKHYTNQAKIKQQALY
ncbi:5018_t:CDS:2, partial [Dentiscutata heterogama]